MRIRFDEQLELELIDCGVDEVFADGEEIVIYGPFEAYGAIQKYSYRWVLVHCVCPVCNCRASVTVHTAGACCGGKSILSILLSL